MAKKNQNNQNADENPSGEPSRRQRLRAEQARAEKERRVRTGIGIGVVVVVVAILAWVVISMVKLGQPATPVATGSAATTDYTVTIGKAEAPVTVDIYQDFMCPYCGEFERANRTDLTSLVDAGTAKLRIHPMAFLDSNSNGTKYSSRAANAFVTVYLAEPDKALAFSEALFENQPSEGSSGLSDTELSKLATSVGVSAQTAAGFAKLSNADFVTGATNAAFAAGVQSTPTVKIDGKAFSGNLYAAGPLKTAVEAAAK